MKTYTLNQVQDELIGEIGSIERDTYEYELQMEEIGTAIRQIRKERHLTQEELGKLVGVQKAQISRLESNSGNVTMETLIRVFTALKAKVRFQIELSDLSINIGH
jgi:HTH-type transcriptional regulator/antitoxin HipB